MSPTSGSMAGYPYGTSSGYAGAMYAAAASTASTSAASTTKDSSSHTSFSSSLMAAGDSINSLRLKAKQHSTSSSPTLAPGVGPGGSGGSYYPASVSPGKSNHSSESPSLVASTAATPGGQSLQNQAQTASDLYHNSLQTSSLVASGVAGLLASGSLTSNANSGSVWIRVGIGIPKSSKNPEVRNPKIPKIWIPKSQNKTKISTRRIRRNTIPMYWVQPPRSWRFARDNMSFKWNFLKKKNLGQSFHHAFCCIRRSEIFCSKYYYQFVMHIGHFN